MDEHWEKHFLSEECGSLSNILKKTESHLIFLKTNCPKHYEPQKEICEKTLSMISLARTNANVDYNSYMQQINDQISEKLANLHEINNITNETYNDNFHYQFTEDLQKLKNLEAIILEEKLKIFEGISKLKRAKTEHKLTNPIVVDSRPVTKNIKEKPVTQINKDFEENLDKLMNDSKIDWNFRLPTLTQNLNVDLTDHTKNVSVVGPSVEVTTQEEIQPINVHQLEIPTIVIPFNDQLLISPTKTRSINLVDNNQLLVQSIADLNLNNGLNDFGMANPEDIPLVGVEVRTDGRRVTRLLDPGDCIPDNFRPVQNDTNLSQLNKRAVNIDGNISIPIVNLQLDQNSLNIANANDYQEPDQFNANQNILHAVEDIQSTNQNLLTTDQNILQIAEKNHKPHEKTHSIAVAKSPIRKSLESTETDLVQLDWESLLPVEIFPTYFLENRKHSSYTAPLTLKLPLKCIIQVYNNDQLKAHENESSLTKNNNYEQEQANIVPELISTPNIQTEPIQIPNIQTEPIQIPNVQNEPIHIEADNILNIPTTIEPKLQLVSREIDNPHIIAADRDENLLIHVVDTENIMLAANQLVNQQISIDNTRVSASETDKNLKDDSKLKSFSARDGVRYKASSTPIDVQMIELQQNNTGISLLTSEHQPILLAAQNSVEIQPQTHQQTVSKSCKKIHLKPKELECFEMLLSIHNENGKNLFIAIDQIENRLNKNKIQIAMFLGQCQYLQCYNIVQIIISNGRITGFNLNDETLLSDC